MISYNANNWFWKLPDGTIYSSVVSGYVSTCPADQFTDIDTQANLAAVLINAGVKNWSACVTDVATLPRELKKLLRAENVSKITATTSTGKVFDGDETSQARMARAIIAMQATNTAQINWTLTDNTNVAVTVSELSEALASSGAQQAAIWQI